MCNTLINMGMDEYGCFMQMYTILPKVLGRNKAKIQKEKLLIQSVWKNLTSLHKTKS